MPTFGDATGNGPFPSRASFGMNPYPAAAMFPTAWMASMNMGMGMGLPMGGVPGGVPGHVSGGVAPVAANNAEISRGFGAGGNPGAPAFPPAMGGFSPSIGLLQNMDMKSLDNYMEQQATVGAMGMPSATTAATGTSQLSMPQSQTPDQEISVNKGTTSSFKKIQQDSKNKFDTSENAPTASSTGGKTDWDAMYAKALSSSKPV